MNTGEIIQKLAAEQGMKLKQLATKADVPYTTLHAIVSRNSSRINSATLHRLAVALEVPDQELASTAEETEPVCREKKDLSAVYRDYGAMAVAACCLASLGASVNPDDLLFDTKKEHASYLSMLRRGQKALVDADNMQQSAETVKTFLYAVGATIARMPRDTDPIEEFERFLRETAKILMKYSLLNSEGQRELQKRMDELTRLDEFMTPDTLSRRARLSESQSKK